MRTEGYSKGILFAYGIMIMVALLQEGERVKGNRKT
jgi:hypothetical protein